MNPYLSQVYAGMGGLLPQANPDAGVPGFDAAQSALMGAGVPTNAAPSPAPMGPPPPPPPAPAPAASAPAPPPPPAPAPDVGPSAASLYQPQFQQVGPTRVVPAKEIATRGPTANALLEHGQQAEQEGLRQGAALKQGQHAANAGQLFTDEQALEQHAAELRVANARRIADEDESRKVYQNSIAQTAKGIEGDKSGIAETVGGMIGFLFAAMPGALGRAGTMAMQAMDRQIDRKIDVQKFNYQAGLDQQTAAAKQYAMLVQSHGGEEAGEAAYRAAMQAALAAKTARIAEENKGTDAGAAQLELAGQLQDKAAKTAAQGLAYRQASLASPKYQVRIGNQVLPGFVDEKQAQEMALKYGITPQQAMGQKAFEGNIDLQKEGLKGQKKEAEDSRERTVHPVTVGVGSDGKPVQIPGYEAPDKAAATKAREQRAVGARIIQLLDEQKKIRSEEGTAGRVLNRGGAGLYTPDWMNKLKANQAMLKPLLLQFDDIKRLSKEDNEVALSPATDLQTSMGGSGDVQIDQARSVITRAMTETQESNTGSRPGLPPSARPRE